MRKADPEESQDGLLASDDELLAAIRGAEEVTPVARIEIPRIELGGKVLSFRVRGLDADTRADCQRRATHYVSARGGRKEPELDEAQFGARMIAEATIPEDRERLWGNRVLQEAKGVRTAHDLVNKILLMGEVDNALLVITELSGSVDQREASYKSGD